MRDVYKTAEDIVDTLVDVVAKNGNLLVNVTQRPDGTIDDECLYALKKIGAWMRDNGEGIYATRPYVKMGEGESKLAAGAFQEGAAAWTGEDYRFTRSKDGNTVFAFRMREGRTRIVSLGRVYERPVRQVSVYGQPVPFVQKDGCLDVYDQEYAGRNRRYYRITRKGRKIGRRCFHDAQAAHDHRAGARHSRPRAHV